MNERQQMKQMKPAFKHMITVVRADTCSCWPLTSSRLLHTFPLSSALIMVTYSLTCCGFAQVWLGPAGVEWSFWASSGKGAKYERLVYLIIPGAHSVCNNCCWFITPSVNRWLVSRCEAEGRPAGGDRASSLNSQVCKPHAVIAHHQQQNNNNINKNNNIVLHLR